MIWQKAGKVIEEARLSGALHPISATSIAHQEQGIVFTYHLRNQQAKNKPHQHTQKSNPFLPHEPAMFVDHLGRDHKVLLNKFPVLSPHLLICSNTFIAQNKALTESDLIAWHRLVTDSCSPQANPHRQRIGFFNSEPTAGASQPHRHMQVIEQKTSITPFFYAFEQRFPNTTALLNYTCPAELYQNYLDGLASLALLRSDQETYAHNIILTEQHIWLIPRSEVQYLGIYANGLNFTGHFLLKDHSQLDWLMTQDPFDILAKLIKV